jgi:hypothetical protein
MLYISHRGNTNGPEPEYENTIDYIEAVIHYTSFDIEVDVWGIDGTLYLGHDGPGELLPMYWLSDQRFWFHAKNVEALHQLQSFVRLKYFWHQNDDYTLTSNNKIWTYPGKTLVKGAVAVVPEVAYEGNLWDCHAICTDYPIKYQRLYEGRTTDQRSAPQL